MTTFEYTRLPAHADMLRIWGELSQKAVDKTLTNEDLWQAFVSVYEGGPGSMPESAGRTWIFRNVEQFANSGLDIEEFLRATLAYEDPGYYIRDIIRSFLSETLIKLIPSEGRDQLVYDMYVANGSDSSGWASAALDLGVDRDILVRAIHVRLETAFHKRGIVNDIFSFLEYGSGTIERRRFSLSSSVDESSDVSPRDRYKLPENTAWAVLTDEELTQAIRICAERAPNHVVRIWTKLRVRLGDEVARSLVIEAAENLTDLDQLEYKKHLQWLPQSVRQSIARSIGQVKASQHEFRTAALLMLHLTVELGDAGKEFLDETVRPALDREGIVTIYVAWRRMKVEDHWLEERLLGALDHSGWVLGSIVEGKYNNRRQWKVEYQGITYVKDRWEHRYTPTEGDEVLFKPSIGTHLTPRVKVVYFRPIFKDVRKH